MSDLLQEIFSDFKDVNMEIIFDVTKYSEYGQAAHCIIFSESNHKVFSIYPARANIMMQIRFDGKLGFAGGLIRQNEAVVDGLNRELQEEINLNLDKFSVESKDYILSLVDHGSKSCYHLYQLFVSPDDFHNIEKDTLQAREYGNETYGLCRVPLYTYENDRGLPSFLQNNFINNAKYELLYFLRTRNIVPMVDLEHAVKLCKNNKT